MEKSEKSFEEVKIPSVKGKIIALDTETTGFLHDDEVLQLSVMDENGKTIFNRYFKPEHKTSWENAMAVNHITPEMLEKEKPISTYKESIEKILKEAKTIVGYNTGFDMTMLAQNGIQIPNEKKYVDLMGPFAEVYGQKNAEGKPKWQKLITCAAYYGFSQDGEWHNSQGDTAATMHCYREMKKRGHIQEKDTKDLSTLTNFKEQKKELPQQSVKRPAVVVVKHAKKGNSLGR